MWYSNTVFFKHVVYTYFKPHIYSNSVYTQKIAGQRAKPHNSLPHRAKIGPR